MSVHHTFRNVSAYQEFLVDDLIAELERVRNNYFDSTTHIYSTIKRCVENGQPILASHGLTKELEECHNAWLVAKLMKTRGVNKLILNASEDMRHQILALANPADFGYQILPTRHKGAIKP